MGKPITEDKLIEEICKSFNIFSSISTCTNKVATPQLTKESLNAAIELMTGRAVSRPPVYMTKGLDFGKLSSDFGVLSLCKTEHSRIKVLYGYKLVATERKLFITYRNLDIYVHYDNNYFYQPSRYEATWHNDERGQICGSLEQAKKIIDIALFFGEQIYEVKF